MGLTPEEGPGLRHVTRRRDLVRLLLQGEPEPGADIRLVVDDQDAKRRVAHGSPSVPEADPRGMAMEKIVPRGPVRYSIRPPCWLTTFSARASPIPVPRSFVEV